MIRMNTRSLKLLPVVATLLIGPLLSPIGPAHAADLTISVTPSIGQVGTNATIHGNGAPLDSKVTLFWQPWAAGAPCQPTTDERYAVGEKDTASGGTFTFSDHVQAFIDHTPEVQGVIYFASIGSFPATGVDSNPACFTFSPPPPVRYFPETGFAVANGFLRYWAQFGGLSVFGYPISAEMQENGITVQYFERARFEWHPGSNPDRYDVELGRVGAEIANSLGYKSNIGPFAAPYQTNVAACGPGGAQYPSRSTGGGSAGLSPGLSNCLFFGETADRITNGFLAYWQQFGGLAVFGYPISDEFQENGVTVQYFERARFEWHPGSDPSHYDVELGRLGAEILAFRSKRIMRGWIAPPGLWSLINATSGSSRLVYRSNDRPAQVRPLRFTARTQPV